MTVKQHQLKFLIGIILGTIASISAVNLSYASNTENLMEIIADYASPYTPVVQPRSGEPFLIAYPLAIQPDNYVEIDISTNQWIRKVAENGEATISEQQIKEFFDLTDSKKTSNFGIKNNGVMKFYDLDYYEVPMSLDVPNIKAYRLETAPITHIPLNANSQSWLKKAVDNEFRWMEIDIPSAMALRQLSQNNNFNLEVTMEDGHKEFYNIRYAGPELNTLRGQ